VAGCCGEGDGDGCWFAQRVGGWREEGTTFISCWMEKRKACAGSREQKTKAGRERLEEEDETGLGFFIFRVFVFGSPFLKKLPLFEYSPLYD